MSSRRRPAGPVLRRAAALPLVLRGLSLPLAACSSGNDDGASEPTSTPAPGALGLSVVGDDRQKRIVVAGSAPDGGTAGSETLTGKLIIAEGACYSATTRDAAPTLLVFPEGTSVDAAQRPSVVLDGQTYPVGSSLSLRGEPAAITEDEQASIEPCSPGGGAFLVSSAG